MRLMVFSDIHGNLAALESVLAHAADKEVHRRVCLGDLVGYGPFPNECINIVRGLQNCRCVAGNHDTAAVWESSPYGMSSGAKKAIFWTMDQLTDENRRFLGTLPDRLDLADMTFVHANPYNPRGGKYILGNTQAVRSFFTTKCRHLFIGHTHRPAVITRRNILAAEFADITGETKLTVDDFKRRIINCGSIGQPRDKDPRSCYLVFDTRKQEIEYYRVAYDIEKSRQAIRSAGLPRPLESRLLKGV
ncbi:MAG: metallophosphoesterase [Desulfobacterales bacterium]|nr:metallophosphoesterase [Desulfobacterales bacterium]